MLPVLARSMQKPLICISLILLFDIIAFLYYIDYLIENAYLPTPFFFDKSNTFMDFFNVLHWAYEGGRYTDWGSVYPPLSFIVVRMINFWFSGGNGGAEFVRESSGYIILCGCAAYLIMPAILLKINYWRFFSNKEKILLYFTIVLSAPMLFVLERGNLILLAPIVLAYALAKIGFSRAACVALLINIKPYFVILAVYYVVRRNWKGFFVCTALSGVIFIITGLALDNNFLSLFKNLFSFSQESAIFSMWEVTAFTSSVSVFSYVLSLPEGIWVASKFLEPYGIKALAIIIELVKWSVIAASLAIIFMRANVLKDMEILSLCVVIISNMGISAGGYTLVLYIPLIPVFTKMRKSFIYISLLFIIACPLDIIPLSSQNIGEQYSYIGDVVVDVNWTLGLGSVVRPLANILLLSVLFYEFLWRKTNNVMCHVDNLRAPVI